MDNLTFKLCSVAMLAFELLVACSVASFKVKTLFVVAPLVVKRNSFVLVNLRSCIA